MKKLTAWELIYAFVMAVACAVSYLVTTELLGGFIDRDDTLLGGMWAAVATLFVFRETREGSLSAGISRLAATFVSFVLCFIYIALLPVNAAGMGLIIGVGTIVMLVLGRHEDIVTHRDHDNGCAGGCRHRPEVCAGATAAASARHGGWDRRRHAGEMGLVLCRGPRRHCPGFRQSVPFEGEAGRGMTNYY